MAENGPTVESWNRYETQSWIPAIYARENETLTKALQISLSEPTIQNRSSIYRKIAKRKSRVSKQTPTTYINADPANFRRMVQEVTGIRIGEVGMPVEPAVWREPEWSGFGSSVCQPQTGLTTLDSSALMLDCGGPTAAACGSIGPAGDPSFFDFESFQSFPTLESWGAM